MANLAIIPARGGSKRIPRKNIQNFLGKPIIAYSIELALKSGLFDEVMVSTDDLEIAEIAKKYGAKVPFYRNETTSNDYATTFEVINEVLSNYSANGKEFEYTCCLYACSPLTTELLLNNSFRILKEKKFDSVFPVMSFSFPIQRAIKLLPNNKIDYFYPEYSLTRSQDLEKSYHDAGQFYWLQTKACIEKSNIITNNSGSIVISELEGQDIDNETDWKLAELKYECLQSYK
jgi:N-acylneuraminate cytidylyltransferase